MKAWVDYPWVWVWVLVMNDKWEVLVNKRWPKANNERGLWEFPWGTVEFWDTLEETVKKEVFEETWVKVKVEKLLGTFDHIIVDEKQHWVNNTFLAKMIGWEIRISDDEKEKIEDCQWVKLADSENLELTQASRDTLKSYYNTFPKV